MTIARSRILLAFAVAFPTLVGAQRGGRSGRDPEMRRMTNEQGAGLRLPTKSDIEQLSPSGFLVDKRKKLQLDEKMVDALRAAETAEKERNRELLTTYDSVRREVQKFAGNDLPSAPEDGALRQMAFSNLRQQVRETRVRDRAAALAAVPEDKRAAAEQLLKENDEDYDKKVGAGGRGRRGGG